MISKCSSVFIDMCVVIGKCVFQPCSSSRRPVSLIVRGRLHTGASQEKRKEANPIFKFHFSLYI